MTDVYSGASDSPIKRKKWRHNRGCCLAAIISDFPSSSRNTSKAATTFLAKIAKGEEESAEEMALLTHLGGEETSFVSYDDDPGASIGKTSTNQHARRAQVPPQQCRTPPARTQEKQLRRGRRTVMKKEITFLSAKVPVVVAIDEMCSDVVVTLVLAITILVLPLAPLVPACRQNFHFSNHLLHQQRH